MDIFGVVEIYSDYAYDWWKYLSDTLRNEQIKCFSKNALIYI